MFYFYVLQSESDYKYYYGSTKNLKRRFDEHQHGLVESTSYRLPVNLIYYEAYRTIDKARLRERQVKASGSVRKALHARIESHEGPARPPTGKPGQ